uniref:Ankyrin repeat domain 33Aa n=1 Tax=Electrophorus electricus TaxID=8005 RepID=A0A4W4GR02_ELEEL
MAKVRVTVHEDSDLGSESEASVSGCDSDSWSVLSDDSVLPDYAWEKGAKLGQPTLCTSENISSLWQNGLMLAVSRGFIDIVYVLNQCPFLDINHRDKDSNMAFMIAAQDAAFVTILSYILNYFSGVDTEVRGYWGFTLISLPYRVTATGHFETFCRLRFISRSCAEQFCECHIPECPALKALVSKGRGTKGAGRRVAHCLKATFTFSFPQDPQDSGIPDHMGYRPFCPAEPPHIGKGRHGAPEPEGKNPAEEPVGGAGRRGNGSVVPATPTSASDSTPGGVLDTASRTMHKLMPRGTAWCNSVHGADSIPHINVTRSPEPTPKKNIKRKCPKVTWGLRSGPLWKYREAKLEKKTEEVTQIKYSKAWESRRVPLGTSNSLPNVSYPF